MSDNHRKKERQRLKRKKKAEKLRKERGRGSFEQAARAGKIVSCLICHDWKARGQAVIYVLRSVPERLPVMASYMIDLWCAGLKDAWGNQNIDHESFRGIVERMEGGTGLKFVPCPVELAKRLTAGSVRFARQNGFRLPANWPRWAALLDVEEAGTASADLGDFGQDGKLLWTAPLSDLRRRLVGSSVEEFLARPGVQAVFEPEDDDGPEGDDDEGDDDEDDEGEDIEDDEDDLFGDPAGDDDDSDDEEGDMIDVLQKSSAIVEEGMINGMRKWCFANGRVMHPRAEDAVALTLTSVVAANPEDPDGLLSESESQKGFAFIRGVLAQQPPQDRIELMQAMEQVQEFMRSFGSAEEMNAEIGLDQDEDKEDEEDAKA